MKLRTVLPMLAVATFALAACASKVDFATYKEKAVEACKKESGYKKFTMKGTVKEENGGAKTEIKLNHTYEITDSLLSPVKRVKGEEGATYDSYAYVVLMMRADTFAIAESEDCTYYAGSTFKVVFKDEDGQTTYEFDKFGYVTSMKGKSSNGNDKGEGDIKVSWSK